MGMFDRPLEAASTAGAIDTDSLPEHPAKRSDSIHTPLAKTMRTAPYPEENTAPKRSLRKKLLRALSKLPSKLLQAKSPPPAPAAETYQTEGIVFNLLSHVPARELDGEDDHEEDDNENDENEREDREGRKGMDLGTNADMIGEFRNATIHTTAIDLPFDIWRATVLRNESYNMER